MEPWCTFDRLGTPTSYNRHVDKKDMADTCVHNGTPRVSSSLIPQLNSTFEAVYQKKSVTTSLHPLFQIYKLQVILSYKIRYELCHLQQAYILTKTRSGSSTELKNRISLNVENFS